MRNLDCTTSELLETALERHRKWVRGEPGGERVNLSRADLYGANLSGANLYRADLSRADLGCATFLGSALALLGACRPAIDWVETQADHSDLPAVLGRADPEYRTWLRKALGGEVTPERHRLTARDAAGWR